MTGPEHYKVAERLLRGDAQEIAQAQVHATLALAAATVDSNGVRYEDGAWGRVTT